MVNKLVFMVQVNVMDLYSVSVCDMRTDLFTVLWFSGVNDDDHKNFVVNIWSNINLFQNPNCKKSCTVQEVRVFSASFGIKFELWYEILIRRCWTNIYIQMNRKLAIRNEKSSSCVCWIVLSRVFHIRWFQLKEYVKIWDCKVSILSFTSMSLGKDLMYKVPECRII